MKASPYEVADYIRNKSTSVDSCEPVTVTIGNQVYPAALYTETLDTPPGCDAYRNGQRIYQRTMIYAVGMLPRSYTKSTRVAFKVADDSRDWYVAAYFGNLKHRKQEVASPSEFHPWGNMVLLAPWDLPDAIDRYEPTPYRRKPMHISS